MKRSKIEELHKLGFAMRRLKGKVPAFKGAFDKGDELDDLLNWTDNIGVLTGYLSGVVCLDLDVHNGINGMQNLKDFMISHELKLPRSRTIKSPTGGQHIYYKLPVEYNDRRFHPNVEFIEGLDFRNHRQFMVLEDSVTEKGKYEIVVDIPFSDIPTCPQWILDLYLKEEATATEHDGKPTFIGSKMIEWGSGVQSGNRNNWLTKQVGFMFRQGMDFQNVFKWASVINVNFIEPPLEQKEVEAMINSVGRNEMLKRKKEV